MALSSISAAWATQYGVFDLPTGWNASVVKLFAQRVSGMADMIHRQPYRIGYLTPASAIEVNLPFASIVNRRGRVSVADTSSVQAAMEERSQDMSSQLTGSLVDCENEDSYPIASYSYFIVRMTQVGNCSAKSVTTLKTYLEVLSETDMQL